MTQREVALALGISRPMVQVIERVALNKMRLAFGLPVVPLTPSQRKLVNCRVGAQRCSVCRERGHNAAGCVLAPIKPGKRAKVWA